MQKQIRAALYLRLSHDDDGEEESGSILSQRRFLTDYAKQNEFEVVKEYVDDGFSGTNFDRPAFQRMIRDIEAGGINMVLVKDLSRLGRDYITAGQYTELYFPEHHVRCIAVNDGYDSDKPGNDLMPFQHVINEMYARDISKKIRAAFSVKMREGEFIGNFAPYGYRKDPQNKNRLVTDPPAAAVVRKIFLLAANGTPPSRIAEELNAEGIETPLCYRRTAEHQMPAAKITECRWTSSGICKLLRNEVYLGNMVQGKSRKPSFKSKSSRRIPQENWIRILRTHEPIVSRSLFERASMRSVTRKRKECSHSVLNGLLFCDACGAKLSFAGGFLPGGAFVCGGYKQHGVNCCTRHFIRESELKEVLISALKKELEDLPFPQDPDAACEQRDREKRRLGSRLEQIDGCVKLLYEDVSAGLLSRERFAVLLTSFETERKDLLAKLSLLGSHKAVKPVLSWESLFEQPDAVDKLLPVFIKRVIVGEKPKQGGKRPVEIIYRF